MSHEIPMVLRRFVPALALTISFAASFYWWPKGESGEKQEQSIPESARSDEELPSVALQGRDTSVHAAVALTAESSSIARLNDTLRTLERISATDKKKALDYARETAALFPEDGVQAEARSAKEITLLVDLDRMQEARALVRDFINTHPDSRYRPLVQGVTGIHPRPTGPRSP